MYRAKVRERLADLLGGDHVLAHNIELAVFNDAIASAKRTCTPRYWEHEPFRCMYTAVARHILFNLRHPGNQWLKDSFMAGGVTAQELVLMSPLEMFPGRWARHLQAAATQEAHVPAEAPEGGIKCGRCKSMRTTYVLLQTRSANESMTAYVTCSNC